MALYWPPNLVNLLVELCFKKRKIPKPLWFPLLLKTYSSGDSVDQCDVDATGLEQGMCSPVSPLMEHICSVLFFFFFFKNYGQLIRPLSLLWKICMANTSVLLREFVNYTLSELELLIIMWLLFQCLFTFKFEWVLFLRKILIR